MKNCEERIWGIRVPETGT